MGGEFTRKIDVFMGHRLIGTLAAMLIAMTTLARAAVWTVDDQRDNLPEANFTIISEAIAAAADGDEIIVYPGMYYEQLDLRGRRLHVRSVDPSNPELPRFTVVDAHYAGPAVVFQGDETAECIVEGLMLTHGIAASGGGVYGGNRGAGSAATIRRNIISSNVALQHGGGLYRCSGLIANNLIEMNLAGEEGGGLAMCGATILDNEIRDNKAVIGGGLILCEGAVIKNYIHENDAQEGGGAMLMVGEFAENIVYANTARAGAGLSQSAGSVHDNYIYLNASEGDGGGLYNCNGSITANRIDKNKAVNGAGVFGGGAELSDNVIERNWATGDGGGICKARGTIENNEISANFAEGTGGGAFGCGGAIRGNTITRNVAQSGGGIADCTGPIVENVIQANEAGDDGGGLLRCGVQIQNNLLEGNTAAHGGAMAICGGSMLHNTFAYNQATTGSAIFTTGSAGIELRNNIFYKNHGDAALGGDALHGRYPCMIEMNCFYGNAVTGASSAEQINGLYPYCRDNFTADPLFVNAGMQDYAPGYGTENDYHLAAGSSCLDRASWNVLAYLPARDRDGLCRVANWKPDLGCYERGAKVDMDGDGLDDATEKSFGTQAEEADSDGDGLCDGLEVARESSPLDSNKGGVVIVPTDRPDAQTAVLFAFSGDLIVLNPGTYYGPLNFGSRAIRLRSRQPYLPGYPETTKIDAMGQAPAITMDGIGTAAVTIEGLTIERGAGALAGAIRAGSAGLTLSACIFKNNEASNGGVIEGGNGSVSGCTFKDNWGLMGGCFAHYNGNVHDNLFENNSGGWGGVFYACENTTITKNTFRGNHIEIYGGVAFECFGEFSENVLENNSADQGGALYRFTGPILRNQATGNSAKYGGVFLQCQGTIAENTVTSNTARYGAAAYDCDGQIVDNLFTGNRASMAGGALSGCDGPIRNNRFVRNAAYDGGAMINCSAKIEENIFSGNTAGGTGGALTTCADTLRGNIFEDNHCDGSGGALYAFYGTVIDNTFRRSSAWLGGAIFLGEGEIEKNIFESNAASEGGAIDIYKGNVHANRFIRNLSTGLGGAIAHSTGTFLDNLFQENSAADGGGLYACKGAIAFNTLISNTATKQGGGLKDCTGASITNNIFYGNNRYGIYITNEHTSPTLLANNCFHKNGVGGYRSFGAVVYNDADRMNEELPQAEGNIDMDPKVLSDDDVHLRPDSPCIDAGYAAGISSDLDGVDRPLDGNGDGVFLPDIGAYEFYGVMILSPAGNVAWKAGSTVEIRWQSVESWAGKAVRFELWLGDRVVAVLGEGKGVSGTVKVKVPANLYTGEYRLRAVSVSNPKIVGVSSARIAITGKKTAVEREWRWYR